MDALRTGRILSWFAALCLSVSCADTVLDHHPAPLNHSGWGAAGSSATGTALYAVRADPPAPPCDQRPPSMLNGIAIDAQGYFWVTDGLDSELLRLDLAGETILERYGPERGIDGPDDLVLDDNYVYYTSNWTLAGAVGRLDRRTGEAGVLAATGLGTNPIVWSPAGKLLAGIALGGSGPIGSALRLTGLFEVDPMGQRPAKRVLADSNGINAFCFAPDGFIYGPALSRLVRVHLESGAIETLRDGFGFLGAVRYNPRDQALSCSAYRGL